MGKLILFKTRFQPNPEHFHPSRLKGKDCDGLRHLIKQLRCLTLLAAKQQRIALISK
ncbi:hypothetical protein [Nostoc linckia]|uniref:hypothetical protein n=1 Tax=Nostoc linckia TaxID=92942 RepID=UPI0015D4E288|nr:hypothetical protein [Nostoc linckia]